MSGSSSTPRNYGPMITSYLDLFNSSLKAFGPRIIFELFKLCESYKNQGLFHYNITEGLEWNVFEQLVVNRLADENFYQGDSEMLKDSLAQDLTDAEFKDFISGVKEAFRYVMWLCMRHVDDGSLPPKYYMLDDQGKKQLILSIYAQLIADGFFPESDGKLYWYRRSYNRHPADDLTAEDTRKQLRVAPNYARDVVDCNGLMYQAHQILAEEFRRNTTMLLAPNTNMGVMSFKFSSTDAGKISGKYYYTMVKDFVDQLQIIDTNVSQSIVMNAKADVLKRLEMIKDMSIDDVGNAIYAWVVDKPAFDPETHNIKYSMDMKPKSKIDYSAGAETFFQTLYNKVNPDAELEELSKSVMGMQLPVGGAEEEAAASQEDTNAKKMRHNPEHGAAGGRGKKRPR